MMALCCLLFFSLDQGKGDFFSTVTVTGWYNFGVKKTHFC